MIKGYFKHIDYIKNISQWSNPLFCPMIKRDTKKDEVFYGVIHVENLTTIKDVNLFLLPPTKKEFLALDGWTYNSVEEMVIDEWEVD